MVGLDVSGSQDGDDQASPVSQQLCTPRKETVGETIDDGVQASQEEEDDQASCLPQQQQQQLRTPREDIDGNNSYVSAAQEETDLASPVLQQVVCTPRNKEIDEIDDDGVRPGQEEDDHASYLSQVGTRRKELSGNDGGISASQEVDDQGSPLSQSSQVGTPLKGVHANDDSLSTSQDGNDQAPSLSQAGTPRRKEIIGGNDDGVSAASREEGDQASPPVAAAAVHTTQEDRRQPR